MMRRPLMHALAPGLFGATLTPAFAAAPSSAVIAEPYRAALSAWAASADLRNDRQTLNPSTTLGFANAVLGEEMIALYGKTGPEFTEADVAQARQRAKDCMKQVGKAEAKVLSGLERILGRDLGEPLKPRPEGRRGGKEGDS